MEPPSSQRAEGTFAPGRHSQVKRHADRARYDRATVHAIIDEAMLCHVAFVVDGQALSLPTAHGRVGDCVYLHGAVANRSLRATLTAGRAALTFTLVDGLVFARTAFHHSMNYRSAVVFGEAREVVDPAEKRRALAAIVDHAAEGRAAEVGLPSDAELAATAVVRVIIDEASAKVRSGPPVDDPEVAAGSERWAGELPLRVVAGAPVGDPHLTRGASLDPSISARARTLGAPALHARWHEGHLLSTDRSLLDLALVHRFLSAESYWAAGVSLEAVRASVAGSLAFGLYRDGAQLGFARVVTDGARFAYLADVFVLASHRGKGLGQELVRFALGHPDVAGVDRVLLGTKDAHALYARLGFQMAPEGRYMVRLAAR